MKALLTSTTVAIALAGFAACTRQTPDQPAPTAIVVAPVASAAFPSGPASDPSLPPASVVASQPLTSPSVDVPASSALAGMAASAPREASSGVSSAASTSSTVGTVLSPSAASAASRP